MPKLDKTYVPATRNFDRVRFENLRRTLDIPFNLVHDELSTAYYDYWRKGLSYPYQGYDVLLDVEGNFVIFEQYNVAFHNTNKSLDAKDKIDEQEYRYGFDFVTETPIDKVQESTNKIAAFKSEGIELSIVETEKISFSEK